MSSQEQQQQQPVLVYPNSVTNQPAPAASHSNGSFGSVFIVLAVIVVVSAGACFLGRLCSRRYHRHNHHPKAKQSHGGSKSKQKEAKTKHNNKQHNHNHNHNQNFHGRDGDIEFGFDKGIPSAKQGPRPFGNGGVIKGEPRFADGVEFYKASDFNAV